MKIFHLWYHFIHQSMHLDHQPKICLRECCKMVGKWNEIISTFPQVKKHYFVSIVVYLVSNRVSKLGTQTVILTRIMYSTYRIFKEYENSRDHINCLTAFLIEVNQWIMWKGRCQAPNSNKDWKQNYWQQVFRCILAVMKKISTRESPFRGKTEKFTFVKNGNFMMNLELIATFDLFL